jgi:hypothetical protein
VATAVVEPVRTYLTTRALGISAWRFVHSLAGLLQATTAMAGAVLLARAALLATGVPAAARLALLVLLGVVVFVPCCLWRAPEVTVEIGVVFRRGGARATPGAAVEPLERV